MIPFAVFASIGLGGCGANNETAVQDRNTNITQPLGYYSNENHENNGGNATILDQNDNDGPITEIMDRSTRTRDETNVIQVRENATNFDGNYNQSDNRRSTNGTVNSGLETRSTDFDGNYNQSDNHTSKSNYSVNEDQLIEKIGQAVASVSNVRDVQSVIYGDNVLIAVDIKDEARTAKTKNAIEKAVKPYLKGRTATIVTDETTLKRVRNINTQNGLRTDELRDLFRSVIPGQNINNR